MIYTKLAGPNIPFDLQAQTQYQISNSFPFGNGQNNVKLRQNDGRRFFKVKDYIHSFIQCSN